VRPIEAKIPRISAGEGRFASGVSRVAYHVVESAHSWSMLTHGPGVIPRAAHHSVTSSSDRKKSMLLQVNTRSSHQRDARTSEWNTQEHGSGPFSETASVSGSPDCSQRDSTIPARCRAAGMPSASHAQFAK